MDRISVNHLTRLRTAVLKRHTAAQIAAWITENTKYAGEPYSYKDHEYQEAILSDTSTDVNVRKCSQVGISEASARMALALVNVLNPYTVAYTLPTAHFAGTFTKTRIDPVILASEAMKSAIHKTNDNNEVKQFGDSFLFVRGAASSNAPISIPCDHLIHDEVDFSDQEVLGQYVSRLTHSKWKRTHRISTPTLPNFGIDRAFQESRRFFLMCKCHHCSQWFLPDYYKHVRIPDYTGDLRQVTKQLLGKLKWQQAELHCPHCGGVPSLQPEYREWVCENPDDGFVAAGYQVSPFDAPNVIKPSYLVQASTKYDRIQDFDNFNLGLPSEDKEATLLRADMVPLFTLSEVDRSVSYVMGVDVGNTYHFVVAAIDPYDHMFVVHTEQVPMGKAKERYHDLRREFRVVCTVIDSGPHAETVMAIQNDDPFCFAAVYMRSKSMMTHTVIEREQCEKEGKEFLRQVNVNRNRAFDAYMNEVRSNHISIKMSDEMETMIGHHTSMKRVKVFDNDSGEMSFSWQKTDGNDHYHHASLYCWIAGRIKGVGRSLIALPVAGIFKFRLKEKETQR